MQFVISIFPFKMYCKLIYSNSTIRLYSQLKVETASNRIKLIHTLLLTSCLYKYIVFFKNSINSFLYDLDAIAFIEKGIICNNETTKY